MCLDCWGKILNTVLFELHFTLQPYIIFYIVVNGLEKKKTYCSSIIRCKVPALCTVASCKASWISCPGCSAADSCHRSICYQGPFPPGCCSKRWSWKEEQHRWWRWRWCWLADWLKTNRNASHPLARFSIPQYSSASCLQGLGTSLQPISSDMSPQSSSPLHFRVLWTHRPGGQDRFGWKCGVRYRNHHFHA